MRVFHIHSACLEQGGGSRSLAQDTSLRTPPGPCSPDYCVADFVDDYNTRRLHSAIGCITPKDKLKARAETILPDRDAKLAAAREARKAKRKSARGGNTDLTIIEEMVTIPLADETEARVRRTRDSRLGVTDYRMDGGSQTGRPAHFLEMVIHNSLMPEKTSLPKARYSLNRKRNLSN